MDVQIPSIHWPPRPRVPRTHTTSRGRQPTDHKRIDTPSRCRHRAARWKRLVADLHYILVNLCTGPAATVCRQNLLNTNGLETWRQLRYRFSIPTGTRSIGYLTKLLKPTLDKNKFEEVFSQWEHDVQSYEQDNGTPLPDGVKRAILLDQTKGALQQHLQLNATTATTYNQIRTLILEYYRSTAAFMRMQAVTGTTASNNQGPAPMEIGATNKGQKGKGNGKGKGGKGYNSNSFNNNYSKGGKGVIGQGKPFKGGMKGYGFDKTNRSKRLQGTRQGCVLQMPSARTHSKALQDADLQSARPNRTTSQRPNI